MMGNRLFQMSLILLIAIALLIVASVVVYEHVRSPGAEAETAARAAGKLTAEDIADYSVPIEEIATNLSDGRIVLIQFSIVVNNKEAKKELEQGISLVKREIIGVLSSLKAEDLEGEEGINAVEARILQRLNDFLQHGEVVKVLTTRKVIQ